MGGRRDVPRGGVANERAVPPVAGVRRLEPAVEVEEAGWWVGGWVGEWVGRWVGARKVEEIKAVGMSYWTLWVGRWVGG